MKATMMPSKPIKAQPLTLNRIHDETVDYIYTDPPYGAKIQYLDLSTMWLAWLDLPVSGFDRQQEIIEGGRLEKTKEEYSDLMAQSIHELYRVMKYDRWMSFVFADKNPAYWHTIVETAEQAGFEYMGAVPQSNSTRSFKKVQHPSTVLSGQLIINFRKVRSPRAIMKLDLGDDATDLILETAEGVIAENDGATIEEINSELIIKGIELGFLDLLSRKYDDLSPLLDAYFDLDDETQKYHLPQNKKFKSAIPVDLRLRYFLLSYLKRQQQQGIDPEFSDIVQSIMPLLKNGITPENQNFSECFTRLGAGTAVGSLESARRGPATLRWLLMPDFVSLAHQLSNLRDADVGVIGFRVDSEQADAVAELGVVDHAEAAALAAPRRPIGQADFVDSVADTGDSLARAFVLRQASD